MKCFHPNYFVLVILNCLFKTGNSGYRWHLKIRGKIRDKIIPQPPIMEVKGPPCQRDLLQMPLLSSACFYLQEKLVSMKTFHYLLLILHFFSVFLGGNSKNFLCKFLIFFLTLGLKILIL